ncbi:hypothetical protein PCE1_004128 [Barthelona sp. PCE]
MQPKSAFNITANVTRALSNRTKGLNIEENLTFEIDQPGLGAVRIPEFPQFDTDMLGNLNRGEVGLPSIPEPRVKRHYHRLSRLNYALDSALYPLGSCTMKYNPVNCEKVARMPGFAEVHPLQPVQTVQGALEAIHTLGEMLIDITGMNSITMAPAAGAHGEHVGLMAIKQAHKMSGEDKKRRIMLVPDSAHGTNPASAAQVGYVVKVVKGLPDGRVDLDDLRAKMDDTVAGFMLTNPSTLGLFETNCKEIADIIHDGGAYMYMDGANLNALLGRVKVSDLGADAMHINLHKTFAAPHGGGGSGSGPVVFSHRLAQHAPITDVVKGPDGSFTINEGLNDISCGRCKQFVGQFGVILRSLAYVMAMGGEGMRLVSGDAVLNANYLMRKLEEIGITPALPEEDCMHECVFSDKWLEGTGVTTMDVAKTLIDKGFHPPTVYFPLVVSGAMLTEPTETETKAALDTYVDAMKEIIDTIKNNPEELHKAPMHAPIKRADDVRATKKPILTLCS